MPQSPPERKLASVVPFERPQSDAQRSVRKRVQERLDREGGRTKPRLSPKRVLLTLAIAVIPVVLTFTSADAVLRRVQLLTRLYSQPDPQQTAPVEEPSDPGVVIMMPDPEIDSGSADGQAATAPPAEKSGQAPAPQKAPASH